MKKCDFLHTYNGALEKREKQRDKEKENVFTSLSNIEIKSK